MIKLKSYIILLCLSILAITANSQNRGKAFDLDKFKEERAQYFIKEVGLSPTEANIFIPLCNELLIKKFQLNSNLRAELNEIRKREKLSDSDYVRITDASIEIKLKEALLDKEYHQKFKKILPPEKLYKYQLAELKFKKRIVRDANK